jgi:hypothetical protein
LGLELGGVGGGGVGVEALTQELEAPHLGLHATLLVVVALVALRGSAQVSRSGRALAARLGAWWAFCSVLFVASGWGDEGPRLGPSRDGCVAGSRAVSPVRCDLADGLLGRDLLQPLRAGWVHRPPGLPVPSTARTSRLCAAMLRGSLHSWPGRNGAVLAGYTTRLPCGRDPGAVEETKQSALAPPAGDGDPQIPHASAECAEVGHTPGPLGKPRKARHQPGGLAQD